MLNNIIIMLTIFLSSLKGQEPWGGASVATPDNLNAISGNPAGLGLERGKQAGIYIPLNSIFSIHTSSRFNGFGYDLKYEFTDGTFPNTFNPSDGNIGFGTALFSNAYLGLKWNKKHLIDLGLLYRPNNLLSFGLAINMDDKLNEFHKLDSEMKMRDKQWHNKL